jgi:hypothetical protein
MMIKRIPPLATKGGGAREAAAEVASTSLSELEKGTVTPAKTRATRTRATSEKEWMERVFCCQRYAKLVRKRFGPSSFPLCSLA